MNRAEWLYILRVSLAFTSIMWAVLFALRVVLA